jgi:chromosome segregation ATPase
MFKFLKDMLKPGKEEATLTFGIDEVAPFLETSLQDVTVSLYEKTNGPRQAVEIERKELHCLLDEISSKEREEAYHPKLEKVAKNTLPLFQKAMYSAVSKELPPDPEEFYTAVGECLKGCVKGISGPGRYLQGVFPEEMKKIKETVDRIGREVNSMTPAIAEARKRRDAIRKARHDLSRYSAASSEQKSARADIDRYGQEIIVVTKELQGVHEMAASFERGPDAQEAGTLGVALETSRAAVEHEERSVRADLAVISHVLRKSEKLVSRSQGAAAAKGLEEAVDLLAVSGIPDKDQLLPVLRKTLPVVSSMVQTGEITLKNKEERELFSPDGDLLGRIEQDLIRLDKARTAFRTADHACHQSRYRQRMKEYESQAMQAESRIAALKVKISDLEQKISDLDKELPALRRSLETLLGELARRPVVFGVPEGE